MLNQLALLMGFQLTGEALVTGLGIPFPGPLCGMAVFLGYLQVSGGPSEQLSTVATTLIEHLGLLFVRRAPPSSPTRRCWPARVSRSSRRWSYRPRSRCS